MVASHHVKQSRSNPEEMARRLRAASESRRKKLQDEKADLRYVLTREEEERVEELMGRLNTVAEWHALDPVEKRIVRDALVREHQAREDLLAAVSEDATFKDEQNEDGYPLGVDGNPIEPTKNTKRKVHARDRYLALSEGAIKLEDLTDEEIWRGQLMNERGEFSKNAPSFIPREFHDALVREMATRSQRRLAEKAKDAEAVLYELMMNPRVPAKDRIQAATLILERSFGKTPEKTEITATVQRWEQLASAGEVVISMGELGQLPSAPNDDVGEILHELEMLDIQDAEIVHGQSGEPVFHGRKRARRVRPSERKSDEG